MFILTTIDAMWWKVMMRAFPNCTFKINYEAVASLLSTQSFFDTLMCFYSIITKFNEPLEAAPEHIYDDRYDVVECHYAASPLDLRSATRL